jgi:hypothetical protein
VKKSLAGSGAFVPIKFNFKPGKPKSEAWKQAQRESYKKRKSAGEGGVSDGGAAPKKARE